MNNKKAKALIAFLIFSTQAFADTEVGGYTPLSVYISPLCDLLLAIGLIIGTYGVYHVYSKWNSGDHNVVPEIMTWFGGCVFLLITAIFVKAMFT